MGVNNIQPGAELPMSEFLLSSAAIIFLKLVLLLGGGALLGGVVGGILQSFIRVEDKAIGFFFRLAGFVGGLYLAARSGFPLIIDFVREIWGGGQYYH